MASILPTFCLSLLFIIASGKVYERCELARELLNRYHLPKDKIATWVCICKHESDYNTAAVNKDSGDHGLFQISQLYWCSQPNNGGCGVQCSALEDDNIADDVKCARQVYDETNKMSGNGFTAWTAYKYCTDNVKKYTEGCF